MSPSNSKKNSLNWFRQIGSNPWIVLTLLVLAVAGVIVAIAVPLALNAASHRESELVYLVNPIYTRVVTAGQTSALEVSYKGIILGNASVTATQIAIWNKGAESIKQDNVLEDVVIYTEPPVHVLEATIKKVSREVTEFRILDSPESFAFGEIPLTWRILEQGDGASIQLIYAGPDDVAVKLRGVIEGSGGIRSMQISTKNTTQENIVQQARDNKKSLFFWVVFMGVLLLIALVFALGFLFKHGFSEELVGTLSFATVAIIFMVFFGIALAEYLKYSMPWPPFGF